MIQETRGLLSVQYQYDAAGKRTPITGTAVNIGSGLQSSVVFLIKNIDSSLRS